MDNKKSLICELQKLVSEIEERRAAAQFLHDYSSVSDKEQTWYAGSVSAFKATENMIKAHMERINIRVENSTN